MQSRPFIEDFGGERGPLVRCGTSKQGMGLLFPNHDGILINYGGWNVIVVEVSLHTCPASLFSLGQLSEVVGDTQQGVHTSWTEELKDPLPNIVGVVVDGVRLR
jgi:hypothetical protein